MKLESAVSLAPLTTFRIGGPANYFARIRYIQDLQEAAEFLYKSKLPFFLLGEGSNTLASDEGFQGLVMKMEICGVKIREIGAGSPGVGERVELIVGAGEHWDSIVELSVQKGLYGIENLSGIPGSVGAAPVQNIGAYGAEVKDAISFVEVFDLEIALKIAKKSQRSTAPADSSFNSQSTLQQNPLRIMSPEECRFGYRDSIFKKPEGRNLVITKVGFMLQKNGRVNIGYKDLKEHFKERYSSDVTLAELRQAVLDIRARKLPDIKKVGTAGSFFKNPFVTLEKFEKLRAEWPDMPGFRETVTSYIASGRPDGLIHEVREEKIKIPLAWILDRVCNLKGWRDSAGKIGTYENQPITLVNLGDGTAAEVKKAAEYIGSQVKQKTGIEIEWEVQMLG